MGSPAGAHAPSGHSSHSGAARSHTHRPRRDADRAGQVCVPQWGWEGTTSTAVLLSFSHARLQGSCRARL